MLRGCALIGCSIDGALIHPGLHPMDMGNGNLAFPADWSAEECAGYRRTNNIPGAGWPHPFVEIPLPSGDS